MKTLIALLALCLISSTVYAKKSIAVPVPTASPIMAQAENKDPFNKDRLGQTAPTPAPGPTVQPAPVPAPAPVPVVVQASPPPKTDWTQTGIMGGLAMAIIVLLGKQTFFPKHGAATAAPAKPGDIVSTTPSHSLNINDTVLGMIERLIETGLPGEAIQLGMSLIPGAGPLVSKLEPAFRQISIKFLQSKIGTVATVVPTGQTTAVAPNDVLGTLAGLVAQHPAAAGTGADAVQRLEEILTLLRDKAKAV